MAFNNSLTARLDELRSPNPPRMANETSKNQGNPFRYSGSFMSPPQNTQASSDAPSLQRRFTADLSKMSSITPIGQMPSQAHDSLDLPAAVSDK